MEEIGRTRDALTEDINIAMRNLAQRRVILDDLSERYQAMVSELGIPTVERAQINPKNYLPMINGTQFDRISPGGGIRTSSIMAYWLTLLGAALQDSEAPYPGFLIIDSPRKAIPDDSPLAEGLYRQLDALIAANGSKVQVIVADNGLPRGLEKRYRELRFSYAEPTVYALPHPGPANVPRIDVLMDEQEKASTRA